MLASLKTHVLRLCLLEYAVIVGTTKTKAGDAGAPLHPRTREEPWPHPRVDVERRGLDRAGEKVGRMGHVDGRRKRLVLEREDRLDEAGHASAGLEVSDLALDRAHSDSLDASVAIEATVGTGLCLGLGEDVGQRGELDLVADGGARAVPLYERDLGGLRGGGGGERGIRRRRGEERKGDPRRR